MENLIQILLPLYNADGSLSPAHLHGSVKTELMENFGGSTAYTRAPAEGRWKDNKMDVRDEIVIYDIMAPGVDSEWWRYYRLIARSHICAKGNHRASFAHNSIMKGQKVGRDASPASLLGLNQVGFRPAL